MGQVRRAIKKKRKVKEFLKWEEPDHYFRWVKTKGGGGFFRRVDKRTGKSQGGRIAGTVRVPSSMYPPRRSKAQKEIDKNAETILKDTRTDINTNNTHADPNSLL